MKRAYSMLVATLLLVAVGANAQAPGPYYARGTVYCSTELLGTTPPDSCYGYGDAVQLFDDGAHGDGTAGDGVYGVDVVCNSAPGLQQFKIANADWTFAEPTVLSQPFVNGRAWVGGPGDVVHFRLDFSPPGGGWLPDIAVANDHGYPAGATLELMGSAPELGVWNSGLDADHIGTLWQRIVTIATPGSYEFKFRVQGSWNLSNFGLDYNNDFGRNGSFTTTAPDTEMLIQFDELTGRIRAIDNGSTATVRRSWGQLKVRPRD